MSSSVRSDYNEGPMETKPGVGLMNNEKVVVGSKAWKTCQHQEIVGDGTSEDELKDRMRGLENIKSEILIFKGWSY